MSLFRFTALLYIEYGIVLGTCFQAIPAVLADVFRHAFTPHAAVGAFAGSSIMIAMSHGIKRACYSLDVGVGYASIIHSESAQQNPARQAALTIFEVILDTFIICTMSIVLVLHNWHMDYITSMLYILFRQHSQ